MGLRKIVRIIKNPRSSAAALYLKRARRNTAPDLRTGLAARAAELNVFKGSGNTYSLAAKAFNLKNLAELKLGEVRSARNKAIIIARRIAGKKKRNA